MEEEEEDAAAEVCGRRKKEEEDAPPTALNLEASDDPRAPIEPCLRTEGGAAPTVAVAESVAADDDEEDEAKGVGEAMVDSGAWLDVSTRGSVVIPAVVPKDPAVAPDRVSWRVERLVLSFSLKDENMAGGESAYSSRLGPSQLFFFMPLGREVVSPKLSDEEDEEDEEEGKRGER